MGRGLEIQTLLSTKQDFDEIVIAPNAPPINRSSSGCDVAMNVVFTPADVEDVLVQLSRTALGTARNEIGASGTFSFGVRDVGRFRVSYMTQRGSKVVRIVRVPAKITPLAALCDDTSVLEPLSEIVCSLEPGVVLVHGPSLAANSLLVYALLDEVNRTQRGVLYIMERTLSQLMMHHDCVAVQVELSSDVESMDQGVANAFLLDPDIAYIGEVRSTDDMPGLADLLDATILTILSSVSSNGRELRKRTTAALGGTADGRIKAEIRVLPCDNGKLRLEQISTKGTA